jgi:hypothetical protein
MSTRPLFAGAILLNLVTLAALVYLISTCPEARPEAPAPTTEQELTIEPTRIRQLDRKQIPNLAITARVRRTALDVSAVRGDDRG